MNRNEILDKAKECVGSFREQNYGKAENSFQTIANLWQAYLQGKPSILPIFPKDVAAMFILLKIARISSDVAKNDNWIDAAGYAACGGELDE